MGEILISNLTMSYTGDRRASVKALDQVSFRWQEGENLAVMGGSGSGKSTLARLMLGLDRPVSGDIRLDGVNLAGLSFKAWRPYRKVLQGVFQDASGTLNPRLSAYRNMEEALLNLTDMTRRERRREIEGLMERFNLERGMLQVPVRELSGGQQRRLSLLRALSVRPRYLVLDEVLSGLDMVSSDAVMATLGDYRDSYGCSYMLITHDPYNAYRLADRCLLLEEGRLAGQAVKQERVQAVART
ncbi:ATP-binding cassette domain-containing protein [Paenibacillus apiarius]|uniref:ATP-binding cassette domain-containing protein n=1 Tax=Paenibacillus apiarius TaxID=46240 RepID=A0ABT4DYN0_9BACL|nr:ATP-binding cassette domain-containing protein [Paenibacillus apiarius]MCY9513253.1 ATP-binding cassette domain-containing protein [Paenibacillus apiarius]MCY9521388.1 ATP-binding cassette domain-containing protein [Paenibacillus apiarius]MCY9554466.1 ATP-binding cassette domain-containing protein [Paenibacillus apiarius]MCY9560669.1 ATP-binding cassette domain-containing protein [Paenibacillus apiarius]MCY9685080.1 ATP-binding cassette domain-containing protein [Paenibacillus apiarius]